MRTGASARPRPARPAGQQSGHRIHNRCALISLIVVAYTMLFDPARVEGRDNAVAALDTISTTRTPVVCCLCTEEARREARPVSYRTGNGEPLVPSVVGLGTSPTYEEAESADENGRNDTQEHAERIPTLGTGMNQISQVEITGTLFAPTPQDLGYVLEDSFTDDGAIPLARRIDLAPGTRVELNALIGDGPHGRQGSGSGDYDVYGLPELRAGQTLIIEVRPSDDLETKVGLYDAGGVRIAEDDPLAVGSYMEVTIPATGNYYVFVRGVNSAWPADPFDSSSGPKAGSEGAYQLTLGLDTIDIDHYSFDLVPGDVVGLNLRGTPRRVALRDPQGNLLVSSGHDAGLLLPATSPLPSGGTASASYVVSDPGRYAVAVLRGSGSYALDIHVLRPALEHDPGAVQRLFIDFDGAVLDADRLFGGNPNVVLSPLRTFLPNFGLSTTDEDAVIDAVLAVVEENLVADLQSSGLHENVTLDLLNSRDHADVWGLPHVSRIIVGGTSAELGVSTIATAESVDVGNFATAETAVVLLDLLSSPAGNPNSLLGIPRAAEASMIDLLGTALGNLIAHEAGHLFANYHTDGGDGMPNLMDVGGTMGDLLGVGPDGIFGSSDDVDVDFGPGSYRPREGLTGLQDTRTAVALGLSGTDADVGSEIEPHLQSLHLHPPFPNPARDAFRTSVTVDRAQHLRLELFDVLGRRIRVLYDGWLSAPGTHTFELEVPDLPSGAYVVRVSGERGLSTRTVTILR